mmetsp:Transcript_13203/g.26000  ORF Transcript_13203/g.26000 Transcript_13203/m.26000 type:complete len:95 (-) Transcript_13203:2262-2546(-)
MEGISQVDDRKGSLPAKAKEEKGKESDDAVERKGGRAARRWSSKSVLPGKERKERREEAGELEEGKVLGHMSDFLEERKRTEREGRRKTDNMLV